MTRAVNVYITLVLLLTYSFVVLNGLLYPIKYVVNPYRFCQRAIENPNLDGGDMILPDMTSRFGMLNNSNKWPNGIIPFEIDFWSIIDRNSINRILAAMRTIEKDTCVRFVERTDQENYLRIFKGIGCYSHVGQQDQGEHVLSLGNGCYFQGLILHELMHVIGCFHEHERPDRDKYLQIIWPNIDPKFVGQFRRIPRRFANVVTPFDYGSIMMYGSTAFSGEDKKITIVPKEQNVYLVDVWRKTGLTPNDVYNVNKMYDCPVDYL